MRLNRDAKCFFPVESKDCMKSASYEYRKMSARRGAQFVPIGMPTVCWKTFPAKTTKILSTRNSSTLMMSSSEYLLLESECSFTTHFCEVSIEYVQRVRKDTYISWHLIMFHFGLAIVLMLRPITPELVRFPDFDFRKPPGASILLSTDKEISGM